MDEDNVLPNDGTYFLPREPQEQAIARKSERAKTLEKINVLKELLDHFDKRIEFYGSVDAMPDEVKDDPEKFMFWHNANELTRDNLRSEREYIESLVDNAGTSGIR